MACREATTHRPGLTRAALLARERQDLFIITRTDKGPDKGFYGFLYLRGSNRFFFTLLSLFLIFMADLSRSYRTLKQMSKFIGKVNSQEN